MIATILFCVYSGKKEKRKPTCFCATVISNSNYLVLCLLRKKRKKKTHLFPPVFVLQLSVIATILFCVYSGKKEKRKPTCFCATVISLILMLFSFNKHEHFCLINFLILCNSHLKTLVGIVKYPRFFINLMLLSHLLRVMTEVEKKVFWELQHLC